MKLRTVFITIGFALLGGVVSAPLMADQSISSNVDAPFNLVLSSTCTQAIALNGALHMTFSITVNDNSTHIHSHANSQDISGVGLVDGSRYTLIIGNNTEFNSNSALPMEMQTSNDFALVGQGSAPNMRVRVVSHITVNANGTVTVEFSKGSIVCQ